MVQTAYPKVAQATTDAQFREFIGALADSGVFSDAAYKPLGDSSGMQVKVAAGLAIVAGLVAKSTAVETLAIAAAPSAGNSRIDTVVLQVNYSVDPFVKLVVIAGTAAATGSQAAPSLVPGGAVVANFPICNVAVGPGVSTITAGNVTDRRELIGTNVREWTTATRPAAPTRRVIGFNTTTARWEGWDGATWAPLFVPTPGGAVGEAVLAAATVQAGREALGIFQQPLAPANVAGRIWIKA